MSYYKIKSLEQYFKHYRKSVKEPEFYWGNVAREFQWEQRWDKVLDYDWDDGRTVWFENAKLNITSNCLDRHLRRKGKKTAIIFEPNDPDEASQHISYKELHKRVCKMANVLKEQGIKKGDRVCIYLPMIPELAISMLACARIGAVHSVVFAGFSSSSVSVRI